MYIYIQDFSCKHIQDIYSQDSREMRGPCDIPYDPPWSSVNFDTVAGRLCR